MGLLQLAVVHSNYARAFASTSLVVLISPAAYGCFDHHFICNDILLIHLFSCFVDLIHMNSARNYSPGYNFATSFIALTLNYCLPVSGKLVR